MASPPSVSAPADYSTPSFPFDATDAAAPTGYADGTLVEIRGENGLLLPATENPVAVVGGIYRIQGISSLVGTRGVVYSATSGYARAAMSASASAGGSARAAVSVSGSVGGSARATMSQSASPAGYVRAALTATATLGGQADAAASDTTAPVVGTLTVTPGSGTACTFSVGGSGITDAVGVTKWLLVEGASDPGAADPGQTGATTVSGTTVPLSGVAFTSTASATGLRYWRLHAWDAAGNHGVSAVASATVTIGGALSASDDFNRANGALVDGTHPWVAPSGMTAPTIGGALLVSAVGGVRAAYWNAAAAAGQFSELGTVEAPDVGVTVRQSASSDTCYWLRLTALFYDSETEETTYTAALSRVVAGTVTPLGTYSGGPLAGDVRPALRLEASGTDPVALTAKVEGVTRITYSDTSGSKIAAGYVGVRAAAGSGNTADAWAGGDQ